MVKSRGRACDVLFEGVGALVTVFGKHCSYFLKIIDFITYVCVLKNREFVEYLIPRVEFLNVYIYQPKANYSNQL